MSKGLEALKKIKNVEVVDDERDDFNTFPITAYLKEEISIVEKELKALEFIKKYIVMNRAFGGRMGTINAKNILIEIKALVPKEEYDLLKEVLL